MTTDQPQPTPGQHVLVEAKVINFDSGIPVLRVAGSRSQAHFDPAEVRWRPMPDETAAETLALVVDTLYEADGMPDRDKARDVLNALADAGLLVEPGGETREEWGYRGPARDYPCDDEEHADRHRAWLQQQGQHVGPKLRRTIHTGPWREVPDGE